MGKINEEKYIGTDSVGVKRYHYKNDEIEIEFSSLEEEIVLKKLIKNKDYYRETKVTFDIMVHEWFDKFEINLPNMVHDTMILENLLVLFDNFSVTTKCENINDCKANFRLRLGRYVGKFSYNPKYKKWKFENEEILLFNKMREYINPVVIAYWFYAENKNYKLEPIEKWFLGMFSFEYFAKTLELHEDEKTNPEVLDLYHRVLSDPLLKFAVDFDFIEWMK